MLLAVRCPLAKRGCPLFARRREEAATTSEPAIVLSAAEEARPEAAVLEGV
jgi:hypothetical protein